MEAPRSLDCIPCFLYQYRRIPAAEQRLVLAVLLLAQSLPGVRRFSAPQLALWQRLHLATTSGSAQLMRAETRAVRGTLQSSVLYRTGLYRLVCSILFRNRT